MPLPLPLRLFTRCLPALMMLSTGVMASPERSCFDSNEQRFSEVLNCYRQAEALKPLDYTAEEVMPLPGVEKRRFTLRSQEWSPSGFVTPDTWVHTVDVYIPDQALHGQALLVANNGTLHPLPGPQEPTDFTQDMALNVARQTRTIVVSVSNVPSQYLTWTDDHVPRREDDSVAHSWHLFLQQPEARPFLSLHVPMMQAMIKAMDLAQRELQPWQIERFIAAGASKRGWATWMAALTDTRVSAIVPFVIDILNTRQVLQRTYLAYGKSWPLAFKAYFKEGITQQIDTPNFDKLMQIEDPLTYANSAYAERLSLPKYIVNASGDDFFLPDNAQLYFDQLPGEKLLRVAPNASHYGIKAFVEQSLVAFINRQQQQRPLPTLTTRVQTDDRTTRLSVRLSETPVKLHMWRAHNPTDRDFRQACGIQYTSTPLTADDPRQVDMNLAAPETGWSATYIEATMADGLVITSPVQVLPQTWPDWIPRQSEPACKNLIEPPRA